MFLSKAFEKEKKENTHLLLSFVNFFFFVFSLSKTILFSKDPF